MCTCSYNANIENSSFRLTNSEIKLFLKKYPKYIADCYDFTSSEFN